MRFTDVQSNDCFNYNNGSFFTQQKEMLEADLKTVYTELLDEAGLSLAEEQKNFFDYLHFSPIKVRQNFDIWTWFLIFLWAFCPQKILMMWYSFKFLWFIFTLLFISIFRSTWVSPCKEGEEGMGRRSISMPTSSMSSCRVSGWCWQMYKTWCSSKLVFN